MDKFYEILFPFSQVSEAVKNQHIENIRSEIMKQPVEQPVVSAESVNINVENKAGAIVCPDRFCPLCGSAIYMAEKPDKIIYMCQNAKLYRPPYLNTPCQIRGIFYKSNGLTKPLFLILYKLYRFSKTLKFHCYSFYYIKSEQVVKHKFKPLLSIHNMIFPFDQAFYNSKQYVVSFHCKTEYSHIQLF